MSDFMPDGKLDNDEIRSEIMNHRYSSGFKPSDALVNQILEQFWFHDFYDSFVSNPSFLELLILYISNNKPKKFNRYNFYKFLFDQIVKDPKKRVVLQKIAFYFEQRQSVTLEENEFFDLLNRVRAPKGFFDPKWMADNHLGQAKEDNGKSFFVWFHHTITEFLTAEFILDSKNPLTEFQKEAILSKEGVIALKKSWLGVLRFLLESSIGLDIYSWLFDFLKKNPDNINDEICELLVYETTDASPEIKSKIFELLYGSYFEKMVWLPVWARIRLSKYVDTKSYKRLKADVKKWPSRTETYIRRGNVAGIIEGLFKNNSPLMPKKEKQFWVEKLIEFANNPDDDGNGVLQRHSLDALAYSQDESAIGKVSKKCFEDSSDSLVREAFIRMCSKINPDNPESIKYFTKAISIDKAAIYARHALGEIKSTNGIKSLLKVFETDSTFVHQFLDKESIFNKKERKADQPLIDHISAVVKKDRSIVTRLKKVISGAFTTEKNYRAGDSYFLQQLAVIISKNEVNFVFDLAQDILKLDDAKKANLFINDIEGVLAALLKPQDIENLNKLFSDQMHHHAPIAFAQAIRLAEGLNPEGKAILQKGIDLKIIMDPKSVTNNNFQASSRQRTIEGFKKALQPEPGKYSPEVFQYYKNFTKEIDEYFASNPNDKKRFVELTVNLNLKKINPREFKVSMPDKSARQFTWSTVAAYYGDILSAVNIFDPKQLKQYRQQIIDFIPYAFSDDMSLIMNLIQEITDKDLEYVNKVMSERDNDRRYLIPGTYIYLVGHYAKNGSNIPSAKAVLKSFVGDQNIPVYEQRSALENLRYFLKPRDSDYKAFIKKVFETGGDLKKTANEILITSYRDEDAINWRFDQLKKPFQFDRRELEGVVHSVGEIEDELNAMVFAKPLIELDDKKYLPKFLDLLQFSVDTLNSDIKNKYWEYVTYLWRIIIGYVSSLKKTQSFEPLKIVESYLKINDAKKLNWFKYKLSNVKEEYVSFFGQTSPVSFTPPVEPTGIDLEKQAVSDKSLSYENKVEEKKYRKTIREYIKEKSISLFVSHASGTSKRAELTQGEREFVLYVVRRLKQKYGKVNVFFDDQVDSLGVSKEVVDALQSSKLGIMIQSKRYVKRFNDGGTWVETEVNEFHSRYQVFNGEDFMVVVLYGMNRTEHNAEGITLLKGKKDVEISPTVKPDTKEFKTMCQKKFKEVVNLIEAFERKHKVKV